jgi:uncharacterized phiE125 gp8 family phage protein
VRTSTIISVPPRAEFLHLNEAKNHLRIVEPDEDVLIERYIRSACLSVESFLWRAVVYRTLEVRLLDGFPEDDEEILLPYPPTRQVLSVKYLDADGAEQTLSPSVYQADLGSEPARLALVDGESWPDTKRGALVPVRIAVTAGMLVPVGFDHASDLVSSKGHPFVDTNLVRLSVSGGVLPDGFFRATDYYVRDATTDTFKLAASSGGAAISFETNGSGNIFIGELPDYIYTGALLLLGHLNENREATISGTIISELPLGIRYQLQPYRAMEFR